MNAKANSEPGKKRGDHPFRAAVFRGLGVLLPPLLTIVIFLWIGSTIGQYVLEPFTAALREVIVWAIADIREEQDLPANERAKQALAKQDPTVEQLLSYRRSTNGEKTTYIPMQVYRQVRNDRRVDSMPQVGKDIYRRYVELKYLQPYQVIPYFLCGFILVLYLLGKFMAAGVGRFFWGTVEGGITRVPLVRNVYSSVKQVSDFLLSDREIEYSRVVAVEWPRKGIWSLALVTGSSLKDVRAAANEEVLSVLIPTSPMPMTGFTVTVKRSETIDLNITIDQAIQFIVSCGVVLPQHQLWELRTPLTAPRPLVAANDPAQPAAGDQRAAGQ